MRNSSKEPGMNTLATKAIATDVYFDCDNMWVQLADGRKLGVPLVYFPRLLHATPTQRKNCIISGGGTGLHWEDIDEDICVQSLIMGVGDRTKSRLHPRTSTRKPTHSGRR